MVKLLRVLALALAAAFPSVAAAGVVDDFKATHTQTFTQEFGSGTEPSSTYWHQNWFGTASEVTRPVNGAETGAYDPLNAFLSAGQLKLSSTANPITINGITYPYRTGFIASYGLRYFSPPFYVESRINVKPAANGTIANWPAWWINGDTWPDGCEVDVMEGLSGAATWHLHCGNDGAGNPTLNAGGTVPGNWTGWHNFGVLYEVGRVRIFWDTNTMVADVSDARIVDAPHYLLLGNGIGGLGGPITVPNTLVAEWIRGWN